MHTCIYFHLYCYLLEPLKRQTSNSGGGASFLPILSLHPIEVKGGGYWPLLWIGWNWYSQLLLAASSHSFQWGGDDQLLPPPWVLLLLVLFHYGLGVCRFLPPPWVSPTSRRLQLGAGGGVHTNTLFFVFLVFDHHAGHQCHDFFLSAVCSCCCRPIVQE